jgi:hypothetical protein
MSKSVLFAGALSLIVGGCASSVETERRAQAHDSRARQAAAYEDYDKAADEKHEGDRLHAKAARERVDETDGQLAVPEPPAPPPPVEYAPPPPPPPPPAP